ncbi:MAG: alpha-D-QuiNAc alpha,3-galactosyltransferase [Polaromonas sp.]|nr:alpha-D-QuiNAc alpha,3-galactosyltransferase [Polaromonas sp.]
MKRKLLFFVTEDWFFYSHFLVRAQAASRAGFDVAVLTRVNRHATLIEQAGIRVIPLSLDRGSANPLREITVIARVIRVYRDEQPDIVHHVALKPVIYGSIASRYLGIARVINAPVGMGYIFSSDSLKARLLRPLVVMLLKLLLQPRRGMVVFENPDDLRGQVESGAVRADHAVLIRGAGVDVDRFKPVEPPQTTPVITLAARMLRDKGVEEFVEAAYLLRQRGVAVICRLVGRPDHGNPASLTEKALLKWDEEGIVRWLGHSDDMASVLATTHIACLPSYREGLPKSLLEALACGLPVVTTDVPGCREVVNDGVNGFLVPARQSVPLANALERLAGDALLRQAFGMQGRLRALNEFSDAVVVKATLAIYDIAP